MANDIVLKLKLTKRRLIVGATAIACGSAALAYANVPNTFNAGDTLSAATMNANFAALDSRIAALEQAKPTIVTDWTSYTPVVTEGGSDAGSTASTQAFWRRVGDTVEVRLLTTFTSCGSGKVLWSLPNGDVSDAMKEGASQTLGSAIAFSGTVKIGVVTSQENSTVSVDFQGDPGGGGTCGDAGSGGLIRLAFTAPIKGWTVTGP